MISSFRRQQPKVATYKTNDVNDSFMFNSHYTIVLGGFHCGMDIQITINWTVVKPQY